ncbi:CHAT domain-containing protein [Aquimarina algiphila]|uniref:CHAT domain-containing protein n=1 Tax=Aquimarina algiphila TaxID=2047982 RepID=UPI00232C2C2D|nr:CHAT domain-containing tetratricopeptide repeat protein [Aquimarina algiphila]
MKIILKMVWGAMLIFTHITIHAQVKEDTLQAHQYFVKGDSLLKERAYQKSINSFENAASIFMRHKAWKRYVQSLNKIAKNHYSLRDFDQVTDFSNQVINICNELLDKNSLEEANALSIIAKVNKKRNQFYEALGYYEKALKITEVNVGFSHIKTGILYNNIGIVYDRLGFVDDAKKYYSKALDINEQLYNKKDKNILNTVYLNMAVLYSRAGFYHQAVPFYEKAIALIIETNGENHAKLTRKYYNLGANYSYIEEDFRALQYFQKGLHILKQTNKEDSESFALFYAGIATQYTRLNKLDQALRYYNKALKINQDIYGDYNFETATVKVNIGGTYALKKDYNTSLDYLTNARDIIKKILGEDHREMLLVNDELGKLYELQQKYPDAIEYYDKNLKIALKNFGKKNQNTAECYNNKARIYEMNKEYSMAIEEYHNAIIAGAKSFKDASLQKLPSLDDYFNSYTMLSAVYGKAKSLKLRAENNKIDKDFEQSLTSFLYCDSLIDKIRNSYMLTTDKVALEKTTVNVYQDAVKVALLLYAKTKDEKYAKKAFYFSEKNRARLLDEQLRKIKAKHFVGIEESKIKLMDEVRDKLGYYTSKLHEYKQKTIKDSMRINKFTDLVFSYTKKKDSLMKEIEFQYPKYHQLKYDASVISVTEIQKRIPEKTTLLEYFVTDTSTYAFMISKHIFSVEEIQTTSSKEKIIQFRNAITSKNIERYTKIGRELYLQLIAPMPIDKYNKHLIIIPDRMLWHLNFDLLLTEDSENQNPKKLPYFVKKQMISYANSADLFFTDKTRKTDVLNECLAFSFSNDDDSFSTNQVISMNTLRNTKDNLPGARKEIKAISDIVGGAYFYGKHAIESNFKKNANRYAVIHMAVHGEIDNKQPENSKLHFTQVEGSNQDNYLYNQEIYGLEIPAELAVLSACNTGAGKISGGEGIMSLGRAFQYAGTKSLLLTNWEVSDETTPVLMKNFYVNLEKGMNKAEALQQAKLQYLEETNVYQAAPFYWGGFYLIGDTGSIDLVSNRYMDTFFPIGIVLILVLLLCFFYWFKKKYIISRDKS